MFLQARTLAIVLALLFLVMFAACLFVVHRRQKKQEATQAQLAAKGVVFAPDDVCGKGGAALDYNETISGLDNQAANPLYLNTNKTPAYDLARPQNPGVAYELAAANDPAYELAGAGAVESPRYSLAAPRVLDSAATGPVYQRATSRSSILDAYDTGMGDNMYHTATMGASPSSMISPSKHYDEVSYNMASNFNGPATPAYELASAGNGASVRFMSPSKPRMTTINSSSEMPAYELAQSLPAAYDLAQGETTAPFVERAVPIR